VPIFFRWGSGRAPFVPGHVFRRDFCPLVHPRDCTTHIWTHPVCKGISRLVTRENHDCTHIFGLLIRSLASVALMECALFRLSTYGASRAGVWSRLRKSRSDLSGQQCETLFAIVGGVTVTLGLAPVCVVLGLLRLWRVNPVRRRPSGRPPPASSAPRGYAHSYSPRPPRRRSSHAGA
jgi:hypothetical protein